MVEEAVREDEGIPILMQVVLTWFIDQIIFLYIFYLKNNNLLLWLLIPSDSPEHLTVFHTYYCNYLFLSCACEWVLLCVPFAREKSH